MKCCNVFIAKHISCIVETGGDITYVDDLIICHFVLPCYFSYYLGNTQYSLYCTGDKRLFIRSDELEAAWELFTPLLHKLEESKCAPELYPYGSRGPVGAHYLGAKHNVRWGDLSYGAEG